MSQEFHRPPRRVLRREVVFVGEEDWLPNDDETDPAPINTCNNEQNNVKLTRQISIYNDRPFCRICLSEETSHVDMGRLFSPCRCRGTM